MAPTHLNLGDGDLVCVELLEHAGLLLGQEDEQALPRRVVARCAPCPVHVSHAVLKTGFSMFNTILKNKKICKTEEENKVFSKNRFFFDKIADFVMENVTLPYFLLIRITEESFFYSFCKKNIFSVKKKSREYNFCWNLPQGSPVAPPSQHLESLVLCR